MRLHQLARNHHGQLQTTDQWHQRLPEENGFSNSGITVRSIGRSREGRTIDAYDFGSGPIHVSIISGSHADEPIGSETIRLLIETVLAGGGLPGSHLEACTFHVIPQINPDGEERNAEWMSNWPSVESYIQNVVRELPGDDIEFGYPDMRPENAAAVSYWNSIGTIDLHVSLHGMGYAEGVMLLIERHWTSRTQEIRDAYTRLAESMNLGLHTHNRKGEKGFFYIEDGYTTTPEGAAMRAHFSGLGETETASLFHSSSMEFMRTLSADPLSLVTEIPLFAIRNSGSGTMIPENYVELKKHLPEWKAEIDAGQSITDRLSSFELRPVKIADAIALQLEAIELGIETCARYRK
ncbi:MAG: peptidase M14 [Rhodothermales bacterium]|nr:peptidase M14 [Rhodothermales bacterium]